MNSRKWTIVIVAAFIALVILRFAFTALSSKYRGMMMAKAMIPKVVVSEIKEADVLPTIEAPGRIVAKETVSVIPRLSTTIKARHFKDGDFVKKGQRLITLDQKSVTININAAKADLQSAIAKAKKADLDYERAKELLARDYIAKATYDETEANKDMAHAAVDACKAALADAERLYGYSMIKAEVSGKIGILRKQVGNFVTPEGGSIVEIMSTDPIYVLYSLDSKRFYELREDTIMPTVKQNKKIKMELTLPNGSVYSHDGSVDFYDNKISESTGTIELRATVKNPDNILIPGDFVQVKIFSNTPVKRLIIPQTAVMQDQSGQYIYILDEKGRAKLTRIKTSGQYEKNWIIESGIGLGDKYVSGGVVALRDGVQTRILTKEEIAEFEKMGKSIDDVNANPEVQKAVKPKKQDSFFKKAKRKIKNILKKIYYKFFIR